MNKFCFFLLKMLTKLKETDQTIYLTCRCCRGVMKCFCSSSALCCREGRLYLASRCRYVDVSIDKKIPHPVLSNLKEYHILRFVSLVTSEILVLGRFSDKFSLLWLNTSGKRLVLKKIHHLHLSIVQNLFIWGT